MNRHNSIDKCSIERLKKQKIETKVGNRGRPFDEVV